MDHSLNFNVEITFPLIHSSFSVGFPHVLNDFGFLFLSSFSGCLLFNHKIILVGYSQAIIEMLMEITKRGR